ncbi:MULTISPECIES: hypothetical protein [unclassified Amycolatopsis]|nr:MULTISPECIES: hypothetical protein [unclassified Amycolatopsis]
MSGVPKAVANGRRVAMVMLVIAVALVALGVIVVIGVVASQPVTV